MTVLQEPASPKLKPAGNPKTVAILESSAKMGGIQHTTLALAAHLDRSAWNPIVICPEEGELSRACRSAGVDVRMLPMYPSRSTSFWVGNRIKLPNPLAWIWNAGMIFAASRRVAGYLAELQPDLVLTKGLLCHFYGGLAARMAGKPCLWYVQDLVSERFCGIYRSVFAYMASVVPTRVSAIGPQIIRQLPENLRPQSRVVFNPVDTAKFELTALETAEAGAGLRRELGIPPNVLVIGNAARLTPWKGQHHLIEAFRSVLEANPGAYLLLAGGSLFGDQEYEHRLRRQVSDSGLQQRVILAGHRQDMHRVFAAMDVFAYCAVEKDICPLSLLEAMAAGLPIAAFDIEGVCEAMVSGREGLLVRTANSGELAQALLSLIENPPLRRRLGLAARERVERQFSLERHVEGMQQVFEEVLALS